MSYWSDYSFGVGLALGAGVGGIFSLVAYLDLRRDRRERQSRLEESFRCADDQKAWRARSP